MSEGQRDPFAPTADPERYQPRAASERALAELEEALRNGEVRILLQGPPGIGKTLLVRVLEARVAAVFRTARASYPALPCADLCAWVLRELGQDASEDPEARLLELAAGEPGRPLLLVLDDAQSLPRNTAARLRELGERSGGALVLLAVATEGAGEVAGTLAPQRVVRFHEPMSPAELADYVEARLRAASVSQEVSRRFDAEALARLLRESGGIPGGVHVGATALVRGRVAPSSEPPRPDASESIPSPDRALEDQPVPPRAGRPHGARRPRAAGLAALAALAVGLGLWLASEERAGEAPTRADSSRVAQEPSDSTTGRTAPKPTPPRPAVAKSEPAAREDGAAAARARASVPPTASDRIPVHLNATPWAEIELDGRPLGVTPLAAVEVEPGRHRFRARMGDGRVLERDVRVSPGRRHIVFE